MLKKLHKSLLKEFDYSIENTNPAYLNENKINELKINCPKMVLCIDYFLCFFLI